MIHAGAQESVWLLRVTLCPRVKQMWWPEILLQVNGNNCQNWDSGSVFLALQSHPGISSDPAAGLAAHVRRTAEGFMSVRINKEECCHLRLGHLSDCFDFI